VEAKVAISKHLFAAIAIAFVSVIALAGSYSLGAAISPEQSTPGPVLAVVSHPVADYAARRVVYDAGQSARDAMGVTGAEVFVDPANPSLVVVIHRFPSIEAANGFLQHPALKDAMTRAGVTAPPRRSSLLQPPDLTAHPGLASQGMPSSVPPFSGTLPINERLSQSLS
jgi:hypothetical protein